MESTLQPTDTPAVPGWYWFKSADGSTITLVNVVREGAHLVATWKDSRQSTRVDWMEGLWIGPLFANKARVVAPVERSDAGLAPEAA